ncbi:MAG: hypothetical protein ACI88A_001642 [Paraglaciecola sp.]|jgi:hypothetical protein
MPDKTLKAPKQMLHAQKIANITDTAIRIPFIGVRFGLDSIIGLIPGLGDILMLGVSAYMVLLARQMGIPKALQIIMLRNSLMDFALGLIPIVGDIADIFYRVNKINVRIMEKFWLEQHKSVLEQSTQQHLTDWQKQQNQAQ